MRSRYATELRWDTIHEAEYLAITQLQADPFISVDAAQVARAATVVPVAPLETLFDANSRGISGR